MLIYDPHLAIITETWLNSLINDYEIVPPGYQLFRRDRGSRGGGVAIVVKNGIGVTAEDQIDSHESLILKVSFHGHTFFLCAVYRPPDADDSFLFKFHDRMMKLNGKNCIVTGDFNLPAIDWERKQYGLSSSCDSLLDIMFTLNLEQIVKDNTRGNSILDLSLVSEMFSGGVVQVYSGISDHKLISFSWRKSSLKPKVVTQDLIKDFSRANDTAVIDYLDMHLEQTENDP